MNVIWYDQKNFDNSTENLKSSNLASKCKQNSDDRKLMTINIVCQNHYNKDHIIAAFENLHDKFDNIKLRLAWIDASGTDSLEGLEHESIFIGDSNHCTSFEKLFNKKACIISNRGEKDKISLAYQRHLNIHNHPLSIALGEIKADMRKAEALMRKSEAIFFNLNAIKRQDSFATESCVTGMDIYEACALVRYAGLAKENKLVIFNYGEEDLNKDRAEVISLLIWYYLEGAMSQDLEKIEHNNNRLYMVNSPYYDRPIKFIQGNITGRWWYQHPETLYYVPCTEADYLEISMGKIPDEFLLESEKA